MATLQRHTDGEYIVVATDEGDGLATQVGIVARDTREGSPVTWSFVRLIAWGGGEGSGYRTRAAAVAALLGR